MLGNSNACQSHGMSINRLGMICMKHHQIQIKSGYLSKMEMTLDMYDTLNRKQEVLTNIKKHFFNKRKQHSTYFNISENFKER